MLGLGRGLERSGLGGPQQALTAYASACGDGGTWREKVMKDQPLLTWASVPSHHNRNSLSSHSALRGHRKGPLPGPEVPKAATGKGPAHGLLLPVVPDSDLEVSHMVDIDTGSHLGPQLMELLNMITLQQQAGSLVLRNPPMQASGTDAKKAFRGTSV